MRRFDSYLIGLSFILLLLGACSDEKSSLTQGGPLLTIRASGPCGINAAPVISAEEVESGQFSATAAITVTGTDPNNPGELLKPDARVSIELVDAEQALIAGFVSTDYTQPDAVPERSSPRAFSGRRAQDSLYCMGAERVEIVAVVRNYETVIDGVEETIDLRSDPFPVNCLDPADYQRACVGDVLPDVGVAPDALMEAEMDMMVSEPIWNLQFIQNAAEDPIIGIRDSGNARTDNITLSFRVIDINSSVEGGTGLEGVTVNFDLPEFHPAGIQLDPSTTTTDENGFASVTLLSGGTPGVVTVNATALLDENQSLSARSATVVIRGGIPSGRGFNVLCAHPVIPAFTSRLDSGEYLFGLGNVDGTECTVQLADRVNGVVDQSTQLFFLSEAGTIIQNAATDENGVAKTRLGVGPPAPFTVGGLADGLVTLVAVTRGEEDFYDVDGDKIWDLGLDFQRPEMDLPEPYIDANDNRRFDDADEGDGYIEEFRDTDGDGFWTPANGNWDSDTEIWTSTQVLWVGNYDPIGSEIGFSCGTGCSESSLTGLCNSVPADLYLGAGGEFTVNMVARDDNGNCLSAYNQGAYKVEIEGDLANTNPTDVVNINNDCFEYLGDPFVTPKNSGASFVLRDIADFNPESPEAFISSVKISFSYQQISGGTETVSRTFTVCR